MKKTIIAGFVLILLLTATIKSFAQEYTRPVSLGIYGGLNYNMHSPDFTYNINDINNNRHDLSYNKNTNSLGFNLGGIINIPINNMFVISGRLGYNSMNGKLETILNDTSYFLEGKIGYFEVSPVLQIHDLFENSGFYLLAGLETGIPLVKKYSYYEEPDRQDITNIVDFELLDASIRFAGIIGAGYEIPLNNTISLTPELSFRMPFTKVSSNERFDKWNIPQIRLGVNLTFNLGKSQEKVVSVESSIKVQMREVNYFNPDGTKSQVDRISVEELQYMELFPLINQVFFPLESAEPKQREQELSMKTPTGEFTLEMLEPEAMSINRHTLDIIGRRMESITNADITINAATDGKTEKGNEVLSKSRAEFAKDYLVNNFAISPNRINIRVSGGLPENPSTSADPDGVAENRRITITSTNPAILEPIIIKEDVRRLANPNNIEFVPRIISTDSIVTWKLDLYQGKDKLRTYLGTGNEEDLSWIIFPNELNASQAPVEYYYYAENNRGKSDQVSGSIPVDFISQRRKSQEDLPDKTISKFSLVLFDFDKAEVSAADMKILDEQIIPAIKFNSTVEIYGYTDRIGNENYNRKLAERRAKSVEDYLKQKVKSARYRVFPIGEDNLIFDNDSPIGRQLSRTVQIRIVTPK